MKSEQVGSQLNRQNSSTPLTERYRLADRIAELEIDGDGDNITLKESYINLMDHLEIDGVLKEKISTIGSKIIQQKKTKRLAGKAITESEMYVGTWWFVTAKGTHASNEYIAIITPYVNQIVSLQQLKAVQENLSHKEKVKIIKGKK